MKKLLRFIVVEGVNHWRSFLRPMEFDVHEDRRFELEEAVQLILANPDWIASTAICFGGNLNDLKDTVRQAKDSYPRLTVLVFGPGFPRGEVIVVTETHFSSRLFATLV
jgi:hypothetical protein